MHIETRSHLGVAAYAAVKPCTSKYINLYLVRSSESMREILLRDRAHKAGTRAYAASTGCIFWRAGQRMPLLEHAAVVAAATLQGACGTTATIRSHANTTATAWEFQSGYPRPPIRTVPPSILAHTRYTGCGYQRLLRLTASHLTRLP